MGTWSKCLTLRTGSPSDHPVQQYNHNDYCGSGLDQVIKENYIDVRYGGWGQRKALWPHLRLTRPWVGCLRGPMCEVCGGDILQDIASKYSIKA